ncbi:MAG: HIT family protein [Acidimicrobiales bacterium]
MTVSDPRCLFCRMIASEESAHVVADDEVVFAILDHAPLFVGHVLVMPRDHHVTLADLPADLVGPYFTRVQRVAALLPEVTAATGTFVAMNNLVSQSVPHLHTHVVPRRRGDGLKGFFWPRTRYDSDAHAASVAADLRAAYEAA